MWQLVELWSATVLGRTSKSDMAIERAQSYNHCIEDVKQNGGETRESCGWE